jgi:hypothetical protein
MHSDATVAAIDDVHHVLRDVFRTGRMLRQSYPGSVPASLLGVLAASDCRRGAGGMEH